MNWLGAYAEFLETDKEFLEGPDKLKKVEVAESTVGRMFDLAPDAKIQVGKNASTPGCSIDDWWLQSTETEEAQ